MIGFLLVSFLACAIGAICGIGGGVIIKPVLDMLSMASVSTVSFLSGCSVLAMSGYSVIRSVAAKERNVSFKTATPLAVGAAIGGVLGKQIFSYIVNAVENSSSVGAVQAICLGIITLATLVYTVYKNRIKTLNVGNFVVCACIGLFLGIISSFLGLGGGPINLVVLYYFFSMETKTAASNSLYIILFSQTASLLTSIITGSVPAFEPSALIVMICGGILGGVAGRAVNKKVNSKTVEKLFLYLLIIIVLICIYNTLKCI